MKNTVASKRLPLRSSIALYSGVVAVLLAFLVGGAVSYSNVTTLKDNARSVMQTHEVLTLVERIVSRAKDAETGQRGYLITGDETYLEPYTVARSELGGMLHVGSFPR